MNVSYKNQWQSLVCFSLASLFISWFITTSPFPIPPSRIALSNVIAGSKWTIQIIAAFIFLRDQRWIFIKNIGLVYLIGSCLLLPYIFLSYLGINNDASFFNLSQLLSMMIMIFYYYRAVELSQLEITWWLTWLACQIIALFMQITLVFHAL